VVSDNVLIVLRVRVCYPSLPTAINRIDRFDLSKRLVCSRSDHMALG